MGGEIGTHSYTHLINPPTTTVTAHTVGDHAGRLDPGHPGPVPSFYGITVGMVVTWPQYRREHAAARVAGESGAVANTMVTAVSGNTITLSYVPGGYGALNNGVLGDIPAGTTLTFSVPAENTNFLQTGRRATARPAIPSPTTTSSISRSCSEQQQLGHPIYGAAVPGAAETYATAQNILAYYQSVAATAQHPDTPAMSPAAGPASVQAIRARSAT